MFELDHPNREGPLTDAQYGLLHCDYHCRVTSSSFHISHSLRLSSGWQLISVLLIPPQSGSFGPRNTSNLQSGLLEFQGSTCFSSIDSVSIFENYSSVLNLMDPAIPLPVAWCWGRKAPFLDLRTPPCTFSARSNHYSESYGPN